MTDPMKRIEEIEKKYFRFTFAGKSNKGYKEIEVQDYNFLLSQAHASVKLRTALEKIATISDENADWDNVSPAKMDKIAKLAQAALGEGQG